MFNIADILYKYCIKNNIIEFSYVDFNVKYIQYIEYGFKLNWYNKQKTISLINDIIRDKNFCYIKTEKLHNFNRLLKLKKILK